MKTLRTCVPLVLLFAAACDIQQSPSEEAEEVTEAIGEGEDLESIGDEAGDVVDAVGDKADKAIENTGDDVEQAVEDAEDAIDTDIVE